MATNDPNPSPSTNKPIAAHSLRGDDLTLSVVERAGLIAIEHDRDAIIMARADAMELCLQMIDLLFRQYQRAQAGPFSASY